MKRISLPFSHTLRNFLPLREYFIQNRWLLVLGLTSLLIVDLLQLLIPLVIKKAVDLLAKNDFLFDVMPVIALELENRPGELARIASKFGQEGININYVYGSVSSPEEKCLFVFCPEDIEQASKIF